jgi:TetR/AcrR family transcriptional regulator, tetracycline repressor protein
MPRSRGHHAGLDAAAVLREARWLLDHEGLDAVTMRRIAARLGVMPNALYSHMPDRLSIVDALLDDALAGIAVPSRGAPRARLERLMLAIHDELAARPDLVPHYFARQTIGPEALRLGGATLELLADDGLRPERAAQAMRALMIYTIGSAAIQLPPRTATQSRADFRAGLRWFLDGLS